MPPLFVRPSPMATTGPLLLPILRRYTTRSFAEVPRPKHVVPAIGALLSYVAAGSAARLHKYVDRLHDELGPVFEYSVGPVKCVFVSEADAMRDVLVRLEGRHPAHVTPASWIEYNRRRACKRGLLFMEGEEWYRHRKLLNGMLLGATADDWMTKPIKAVVDDVADGWAARSPFVPDLHREISRTAIEVMLALTFGTTYEKHKSKYDHLTSRMVDETNMIFASTAKMTLFPANVYANLNTKAWRQFVRAIENAMAMGDQIVSDIYRHDDKGNGLVEKLINEGLDKEGISRILIDFIIAAGDTTSYTLQWILYLLATNFQIVETYRTIKDDENKGKRYIKFIIKESMRLYPVAAFITRFLPADSSVGGYLLPAGTLVVMSTYTSSRAAVNFTNPLKFDPLRWDKENSLSRSPPENIVKCAHASLPFAIGSRSCIGRKLVMIEMIELLEKIMTACDLKLLNERPVDDKMEMLLKPSEPLNILFSPVKK